MPTATKNEFVDGCEIELAMQLVGKRGALLQLVDREITGRRQEIRRGAQRILEEVADVIDSFFLGFFLGLGDVGDHLER